MIGFGIGSEAARENLRSTDEAAGFFVLQINQSVIASRSFSFRSCAFFRCAAVVSLSWQRSRAFIASI